MTQKPIFSSLILILAVQARAQTEPSLAQLVAQAIAAHPAVAARSFQVQEAEALARSLGRPQNLELEVAPGIGFTNSNFALGQSFDFSGTRAARAQKARAEARVARTGLYKTQLAVATEFLSAYAAHLSARRNEVDAASHVQTARATAEGMKKRTEIGEAPAVHLTRAEIELTRAEQAHTLARSDLTAARTTVNSYLGISSSSEVPLAAWSLVPDLTSDPQDALMRRPEALEAMANIEAAKAGELAARRAGLPSLFAGVATDTWSLDRKPFQRDNVGFQLLLTMPLFDNGENRFALRSAGALVRSREAEMKDTERRIVLEVETASSQFHAAREVAKNYETGVVPKAEQMVRAMQSGLESGTVSFLEVLEAQRTLSQLRRESSDSTRYLQLAEVRLLAAMALIPGLETPQP